jgi:hypothetical protein
MSETKKTALGGSPPHDYFADVNPINSNLTAPLPESISRYIDASNCFDARAASACFAPDATVHDDEHDYVGIEAIENWISESISKYHAHAAVTHTQHNGENATLKVEVSGQFPGSPVELEFDFRLHEGKISHLAIQ